MFHSGISLQREKIRHFFSFLGKMSMKDHKCPTNTTVFYYIEYNFVVLWCNKYRYKEGGGGRLMDLTPMRV